MKTLFKTLFMTLLLACGGSGYSQRIQHPATGVITVPRWESPGIPIGWVAPQSTGIMERGTVMPDDIRRKGQGATAKPNDPDASARQDGNLPLNGNRITQGAVVSVGREFVANNLARFTPCDNAMAISDSGFIVSADNYTIEYYRDTPDSLLQHQLHHTFYGDTLLFEVPFDPRVIYDHYAKRFILITLTYKDSANNSLIVSFSQNEDPRNGWNHYRLNSDTMDVQQWMDFPTIGMNKNEVFIAGNMVRDNDSGIVGNKMFQIRKKEGYAGNPLQYKVWTDILDADGDTAFTLIPLSDGLMSDDYSRGIYLASNKKLETGQSSNRLLWYQVTDSFDAQGVAIVPQWADAGVAYSNPLPALQLGTQEQILINTSIVQSGFHLNGILNFVYCKNTNDYSTIVLNRLEVATNTNTRTPWGFSTGSLDYCFPSIAFAGSDTSDGDNIHMCFQRTGASIYPELMAVNYNDGDFAPTSTVVKSGSGFIDLKDAGVLERWGDYTSIQRKYDSPNNSCWLAGSYPYGSTPNFWGVADGLNTYIAELADSMALATNPSAIAQEEVTLYPNPSDGKFSVQFEGNHLPIEVRLFDLTGKNIANLSKPSGVSQGYDLSDLGSGVFLIRFTYKNGNYAIRKVILY